MRTDSHAVVIGGSVTGLLTARVLANYFHRVTIVERDRLPQTPAARKGVPQARHTHFMLVRGKMILEHFFPGIMDELVAAGATPLELSADVMWLAKEHLFPRFPTNLMTFSCSRNLLEWGVRQRLATYPQVQFMDGTSVTGLVGNADNTRIVGVQTRPYYNPQEHQDPSQETTIYANMVVDASGKVSQTPHWLQALGYPMPRQTIIKPYVGYATRYYTFPEDVRPDWKVLLVPNIQPTDTCSASLLKVEDNRWFLTMSGVGGNYPPTRDPGFLEFARSLPNPYLYDFMKDCKPESPIYGSRIPRNRLLHYEEMRRWPEQFVVLGDAVCTFNPIYGQGMTVGAEGALLLEAFLQDQSCRKPSGDLTGLARDYQRALAKALAVPWMFTTGEDLRYTTTEGGQQNMMSRLMRWYMDGVVYYATENALAYQTLLEVLHLVKSPSSLFHPTIMVNALALSIEALAD